MRVAGALLFLLVLVAPAVAQARCDHPGNPDCVHRQTSITGTVDFFATGASFTYINDNDDRPDGTIEVAKVTVPTRRIPARATLVKAFLYFGGSLFFDQDGNDSPDQDVELALPGSDTFHPVHADQVYQSGMIPGFPEVILYTSRADITALVEQSGAPLTGTYQVRGFAADIFYKTEEHTVSNASFSLVLIFEEPRLPPRTIILFDGMQEVLGSTVTLDLSGFIVSPVPSGTLTFYALEGDCNPGPKDCDHGNDLSGAERVRVIGNDPSRVITLQDEVNPPNDIFNRTINTVDPPLKNVVGTDIDSFDITPVLKPADTRVGVEITTPAARDGNSGDLIGLAYVIVGIDVFAPELRIDSRIEIRDAEGRRGEAYYPGDPLRIGFALSNTGNLPGTGIHFEADLPAEVTEAAVLDTPAGATVQLDPTGGAAGHGHLTVDQLAVRHGEVREVVLGVKTTCPLPAGGALAISAQVGAPVEAGEPFTMTASTTLLARDRCGPRYFLYGGGGCRAAGPTGGAPWWAAGLIIGALIVLLRGRRRLLALWLLGVACQGTPAVVSDQPPPPPIGVACPGFEDEMVIVPSIRQLTAFCIDRYEASADATQLGNSDQSAGGDISDGSTQAVAASTRFALPVRGVSWFQARAACKNAGKRLCRAEEWAAACRGDADGAYPYGDLYDPLTCNGFDAHRGDVVETGAMIVGGQDTMGDTVALGCVSQHGAYDLSGNLWEWNETAFLEGARRGLTGGSFRSNADGLKCAADDAHAVATDHADSYGFRCCVDYRAPN